MEKESLAVLKTQEKPIFTFVNLEIFLNTINHGLIAITCFYCTWYCIQYGFFGHIGLHVMISTVGYQLLMAEGIMVLYKQNSYTFLIDSRGKRTTIHWVLLAAGSILGIAGTVVEYVWRERNSRKHFSNRHTIWGLASLILLLPTVLAGLTALFPVELKKYLKPLLSKFSHNLFAVATFVTGMISIVMGYTDLRFAKTYDPGDLRYAMAWFLGIMTVITLVGPAKSFANQIRSFSR